MSRWSHENGTITQTDLQFGPPVEFDEMNLAELHRRLAPLADAGRVGAAGGSAHLRARDRRFDAVAYSRPGFFPLNTDNVVVRNFQCGKEHGVLLAVCVGNYKDEACAFASSAAALTISEEFDTPLISEADIAPTLRRAFLRGNDAILGVSSGSLPSTLLRSFFGSRTSLKGIGAAATAVVAVKDRLWIGHIGDNKAYVVRDNKARKLTIEHTLLYSPQYRLEPDIRAHVDPDFAASAVLRALGLTSDPPQMDLLRLDLLRGDRVVLGAEWLTSEVIAKVESPTDQPLDAACDTLSGAFPAPRPATFGILEVKDIHSEGTYR